MMMVDDTSDLAAEPSGPAQARSEGDASTAGTASREPPLFVDLDGTLIRTDLLLESVFVFLKGNPLGALWFPLWLFRGKAYLKRRLAENVRIDAGLLPYDSAFVEFLRAERARGRTIVLATASDEMLGRAIAEHLGIFDRVLGSDGSTNMSGPSKLAAIRELSAGAQFDYAGNGRVDLAIWPHARAAILVNPESGVEGTARRVARVTRVFGGSQRWLSHQLRALRVHQWAKNLLVFVPMLTAHEWNQSGAVLAAAAAFVSFSLCASGIYVLNDMLDMPYDRQHPRKRRRPFASGDVPLMNGIWMVFGLVVTGFAVSLLLPWKFIAMLASYVGVTMAYSFALKMYVLIDVVVLASLYTLRVIAGAAAIQVSLSFWLLAFSMCIFTSLALIKRCSEIITLAKSDRPAALGRDYHITDLGPLQAMGIASGYLAVLVLALFINSPETAAHYAYPYALWLLCPMVLYWISRVWLKTARGEMHDDPLVFAARDRGSRYVFAAVVLVVVLAAQRFY
jgi:4-hydroxybenzoate polyprenyltransferase